MDSLPCDVREKLLAAIDKVVADKPDDILAALADALKPPPQGPIDTRSAAAFNASMMHAGVSAMHLNLIGLGDELGFFRALLEKPMSSEALAFATKTDARYVKEWCLTMAAGTVLEYNHNEGVYQVAPGIEECVAVEQNPAGLIWGTITPVVFGVRSQLLDAYRTGDGIDWNDRDYALAKSTCNFFRPLYEGMLIAALPESVKQVLEEGGTLADIGCGQGLSSCLFAKAFPKAKIHGVDYSQVSIAAAKEMAQDWGLTNVDFVCENAKDFAAEQTYNVTCFLDCFHDMAVAKAGAKRAFDVTKPGGYCFLIEPMAAENDNIQEQLALPTTPLFGAFSCHVCLCCSKMNGGDGLGTLCPTSTHREIFLEVGYSSFEAVESPVNAHGFRFLLAFKK